MKKILSVFFTVTLLFSFIVMPVKAVEGELVYDTYIYSNDKETGDGEAISIPAAWSFDTVYNGYDLGTGTFNGVSDIFYDGGNRIYLCDTGNNRVLIFDEYFHLIYELKNFENNGTIETFSSPTGIYSNGTDFLVCDSKNSRILIFECETYKLKKDVGQPEIESLKDKDGNYGYTPTKAVFDDAGRLYVIADGVNQGIIRLDSDGKFISFIGAPTVVPNISELLWRKIATKTQKERMQQYVPTEYDSLLIDSDGFLYATSMTSTNNAFVRLNSKGENILPDIAHFGDTSQNTYDVEYTPCFADIAVDEAGTCFLLDSKQGKIFAYDADGQLLYAFGANSFQKGAFYSSNSIDLIGNRLVVTDHNKGNITVFSKTPFGSLISEANKLYRAGENTEAREVFVQIRQQCSSYLPATVAISYIDAQNGDYSNSLKQLKTIKDHQNYSIVFKNVRNNLIRKYGIYIIIAIIVIATAITILKRQFEKHQWLSSFKNKDLYKKYNYSKYTMFHPFDGFWDIKHEGRGNFASATILLIVFTVLYGIRAQFSGYIVTETISSEVNGIFSCLMIILPLAFWIISNWCFTTLMDGKGTLKDIYISVCYALKPYIVLSIPLLILSHVLTAEEAMFYTLLNTVCIIWVLGLIFFGMITIHDYSLFKGIITAILTLIGICLIIFLLLLMISVAQNVLSFALDLYKEATLRVYE